MSKVAYDGTGAAAGMSDGRPIIAKTGTTNTAQSAFFIGAIPQESLAIGIFTNHQSGLASDPQTLNGLGGISQGFGGTWPAMIWHTYAQNMFLPLGVEQFQPVVFTGASGTWRRRACSRRPSRPRKHNTRIRTRVTAASRPPARGNPNPYPTYSCDPSVVTCNPNPPGRPGRRQSVGERDRGGRRGRRHPRRPARDLPVGAPPLAQTGAQAG